MNERHELGQFIPIHYHFNMLDDAQRTGAFAAAIASVVTPGMKVVDLGGGTGVQSFFAARAGASRVWCVEYEPELLATAAELFRRNGVDEVVAAVDADADEYLPPEPVDVVICEMLHTGLLRERQAQVVEAFRQRHRERFDGRAPRFLPAAVIQAIQPVQQDYLYHGYDAPTVHFQDSYQEQPRTLELAPPAVYQMESYENGLATQIAWRGTFAAAAAGRLNAARLISKHVLAILPAENRSIDWLTNHLVFPLEGELDVVAGDAIELTLGYPLGGRFDDVHLEAHKR
jgi:protein arginine N-methyltransferase 1